MAGDFCCSLSCFQSLLLSIHVYACFISPKSQNVATTQKHIHWKNPQIQWIFPNGGQVLVLVTEGNTSLKLKEPKCGAKKHSSSFLPLPCGVTNNLKMITPTACRSCSSGSRILRCILWTRLSLWSSLSSWVLVSHTAEISPRTGLKSHRVCLIRSESSRTSCSSGFKMKFIINMQHVKMLVHTVCPYMFVFACYSVSLTWRELAWFWRLLAVVNEQGALSHDWASSNQQVAPYRMSSNSWRQVGIWQRSIENIRKPNVYIIS